MKTNRRLDMLKVLLVEDQGEARAMIRDMLRDMGISKIVEAPDGAHALKFLDTAPGIFDMVICDWNMPGMSGVELLRQLRSVNGEMPFLMVTGRRDMDSVVEAKSSGVTGYIFKPFSPDQLEAKLRIILRKMAA